MRHPWSSPRGRLRVWRARPPPPQRKSRGSAGLAAGAVRQVKRIKEEKLEAERRLDDAQSCTVCLEAPCSVLFLPCSHLACCAACAAGLAQCPRCQAAVERAVGGVFLS